MCWHRECVTGDRISALPDDVLILIISRLKLREAARTSVLSQRWRLIWTLTSGVLDFVDTSHSHTHGEENGLNTTSTSRCRMFLERVNLVLSLHKASTIDEFRVCFSVEIEDSDVVDSWIKYAVDRHVKRLILDLGCFNTLAKYALRAELFSQCKLGSLTTLHLKQIEATGEALGYILSCSPLLQVLRLHSIISLVELKIAGPSPNLRSLVIKHCSSMRYLQVHAVNLVSFGYRGPMIFKHFKQVPCLVEANVNYVFLFKNIHRFSSCFSMLESLSLRLPPIFLDWIHGSFPKLPKFNKLRSLKLSMTITRVDCFLNYCTKLLKASPLLQRFVLKMDIVGNVVRDVELRKRKVIYKHKQLKEIEFIGFRGYAKDGEILKRLLAKLPSLEKVVVDPRPVSSSLWQWDSEKAIATAQLLLRICTPAAKLVIVRD